MDCDVGDVGPGPPCDHVYAVGGADDEREGNGGDDGFAEVTEAVEKAARQVSLEEITASDEPEPDEDLEALRATLLAKLEGK